MENEEHHKKADCNAEAPVSRGGHLVWRTELFKRNQVEGIRNLQADIAKVWAAADPCAQERQSRNDH